MNRQLSIVVIGRRLFLALGLSGLAAGVLAGPAAAGSSAGPTVPPGTLLAASCAACHNTHGRSLEGTPVLAGIPRDQFIAQLKDFQSGVRKATVMHRHSKGYTDDEIRLLADYFANQKR